MKTLKDINWNQVYYFYEVARHLSLKKAAQAMKVSLPTVSEQIKRFETVLELQLFQRKGKKIQLTQEGQALYTHAKEMFDTGVRILDIVSPSAIGGYSVRVGIQQSSSSAAALDFVTKYWDLFSPYGVVCTYREPLPERLLEKVIAGSYDWIISLDKPRSDQLEHREIGTSEVVFCCAPGIYRKLRRPEDILRVLPLALSTWDTKLNNLVEKHLAGANIFADEVIETDHHEYAINLSQRGRCVSVFPKETVENASWSHTVKTFQIGEPIQLCFYAAWKKGNSRMISIRKLVELLNMEGYPSSYEDLDHQIKILEDR